MSFPYSELSATPRVAPRIDTVLFDYGQVLSNPPDPAAWERLRLITGLDEVALQEAYWKYRHDYDRGALTGPAYWQAVAAHAGFDFDADRRDALMDADVDVWTSLNLPMVDWAIRLQRAGVRTGILSNIGDSIANGILARLPWLSGFNHCTWSYAMSMAKPDPAIYLRTAEALRTSPANILFLDDREENIAGATTLGFQTLHFTTFSAFKREMRERSLMHLLCAGPALPAAEPEPEAAAK